MRAASLQINKRVRCEPYPFVCQKTNFLTDLSCADSGRALPCTRQPPLKKGAGHPTARCRKEVSKSAHDARIKETSDKLNAVFQRAGLCRAQTEMQWGCSTLDLKRSHNTKYGLFSVHNIYRKTVPCPVSLNMISSTIIITGWCRR